MHPSKKIVLLSFQYANITNIYYAQFASVILWDPSSGSEPTFKYSPTLHVTVTWRDHRNTLFYKTYPCKQLVAGQESFHCCKNLQYSNLLHTAHLYGALCDLSENYMMVHCNIKVSVLDWLCSLETDALHHLNLAHEISSTEKKIKANNQYCAYSLNKV